MKKAPYFILMAGLLLVNYLPLAHWFWNHTSGWAWQYGVIDYSGGA